MGKILATENSNVFDVFISDLGARNEAKETVHLLDIHDLDKTYEDRSRRRRQIHRVPPQLRRSDKKRSQYDPMVVSLGPYHHGKEELQAAEDIKHTFFNRLTSNTSTKKNIFYDTVLDKIDEIRGCYANDCVNNYDDKKLATMILLDACFIGETDVFLDWHQCLGIATLQFAVPDILLLENQIPFRVVKSILDLQRGKEADELIGKFSNWLLSADFKATELKIVERHPLHLLEACHRILIIADEDHATQNHTSNLSVFKLSKQEGFTMDRTARSVTDLKAKGIKFIPSSACSVRDIKFKSGAFRGELHLPVRMIWSNSLTVVSNMIAYEVSPGSDSEFEVLSYTNFIKSLIESPEDAKELQEKGILINRFQNNEQLVEELRGVDTFGIDNFDIFKDVKMEMEKHCRCKAKTWIADLIHTRFSSPWSVTALLAAMFLVCLSFLQTFFAIHPCTRRS
ncbi:hypothetical protein ACS0TY_021801 [Phlomoides rotata]